MALNASTNAFGAMLAHASVTSSLSSPGVTALSPHQDGREPVVVLLGEELLGSAANNSSFIPRSATPNDQHLVVGHPGLLGRHPFGQAQQILGLSLVHDGEVERLVRLHHLGQGTAARRTSAWVLIAQWVANAPWAAAAASRA